MENNPMIRMISLFIAVMGMAGCTSGPVAPGTLPDGAASGVYTTADMRTVASCIASTLGGNVQSVDTRLVVVSPSDPSLTYSVSANDRNSVYPTRIAISGTEPDTKKTHALNACFLR